MDSGTRNLDFGFWKICGVMGYEGKLNKGFTSFFAMFDDFSKWIVPKALQNFEKSSNMAKFGKK